jgi:hypothetical protein
LNKGRSGIKELTDEAERLGLIIDTRTARAAEEFNDNLDKITSALAGVANKVAAEALPALVGLTEATVDWLKEGNKIERTARAIGDSFRFVAEQAFVLIAGFEVLNRLGKLTELELDEKTVKERFLGGFLEAVSEGEGKLRAAFSGLSNVFSEEFKQANIDVGDTVNETAKRIELLWTGMVTRLAKDSPFPPPPDATNTKKIETEIERIQRLLSQPAGGGDILDLLRIDASFRTVRAGIVDLSGAFKEMAPPVVGLSLSLEDMNRSLSDSNPLFVAINKRAEEMQESFKEISEATFILERGFDQLFVVAIQGGEGFLGVLGRILQELAVLFAKMTLFNVLGGIFGNLFGNLFGGGGGNTGVVRIGGRQHGGHVNAGELVAVGESGMELFKADTAGTIIPNRQTQEILRGAANQTVINIDARGADAGVEARILRAVDRAMQNAAKLGTLLTNETQVRTVG